MADAVRGLLANPAGKVLYAVIGAKLYRVAKDGARTELGRLASRSGYVDMKIGVTQLVIVDGANGYVLNMRSDEFKRIRSPGWKGSRRVAYVDGYFCFADPNTGVFYISQIEDASNIDALDFATASSSPDSLVAVFDDHGELWLPGEKTFEVWSNTGGSVFPFSRNRGATMQTGLMGAFTLQGLDNSVFWLGSDDNGGGQVFRASGYSPQKISTEAVDQCLQRAIEGGADMSKAIAYAYQQAGHSFYVLNVPGLETTWAYDVATGDWHERAELVLGEYRPHRAKHHAYCFGRHIVGDDTGRLYVLDPEANTNAGDPLVRDRVSPHFATPALNPVAYSPFQLDCTVGKSPPGTEATILMRTSDDGGESWNSWREESLGRLGQSKAEVIWSMNGSAVDRVWHVRVTDDVRFAIVGAKVSGRG